MSRYTGAKQPRPEAVLGDFMDRNIGEVIEPLNMQVDGSKTHNIVSYHFMWEGDGAYTVASDTRVIMSGLIATGAFGRLRPHALETSPEAASLVFLYEGAGKTAIRELTAATNELLDRFGSGYTLPLPGEQPTA